VSRLWAAVLLGIVLLLGLFLLVRLTTEIPVAREAHKRDMSCGHVGRYYPGIGASQGKRGTTLRNSGKTSQRECD
jgi:hypothetical protein